ncbi:porin family protein [Devosia sp. MC532]|uniref:outer membrane protein n=1 Tax=Devosia sp. MC532 TaxID=2799788 RepID=UPI0018F5AB52|nr:porin family protein [Devosia sp. MC532]MBJ7576484.1 porin family protein [Devosia sp. MC532]
MKSQIRILILILGAVSNTGLAGASEPIAVPISSSASLPIYDEADFDWSGLYAGISASPALGDDGGALTLGAQLGIQTQFDFYLVGAEVAVRGLPGTTGHDAMVYGEILGRAGVVATDSLLVYTAAGYGLDLGPQPSQQVLLGGGLEIPISDSVSLGAQYLHGVPISGGEPTNLITFGANWHF